jgi:hypothetical protein
MHCAARASVGAVRKAAANSVRQGFLLKEDADRYVAAAEASDIRGGVVIFPVGGNGVAKREQCGGNGNCR